MGVPERKSNLKNTPINHLVRSQWQTINRVMHEYPRQFWVLVFGTFVDHLGGSLLFPFFSLYVTRKFEVGMTQVGVIFAIFSITGVLSSLLGGALTDRIGRKGIIIFGLVMSATSALLMGLIDNFMIFIAVTALVGLLADVGFPAQQAMVADLLPEEKRAQGYGILRVVFNLAVVIGPMVGGFLAARSYLLLFILDAVASLTTAVIVYLAIRETKKPLAAGEPQESISQTFKGYFNVLHDSAFTWFLVASMLGVLVYSQMNTTLAVYLRDVHGVPEQMFGYILSLNAAMVVLFQFPITRWIGGYRPMMVMVAGTFLYTVGFVMYGFVSIYPLFLLAMVIITIGEMLDSPISQSIVSDLAPEEMRGRYMATYGFSWVLPSSIGPLLAGLVIDNLDPHWVWYGAGIIGLFATLAFYLLERRVGRSRWAAVEKRLHIFEQLEEGKITAEEAAGLLSEVSEGQWGKLAAGTERAAQGKIHIHMSSLQPGNIKKEFTIPLGLLNIFLNTDCRLSVDLDASFDRQKLRALISHRLTENPVDGEGDHHIEVSTQ